MKILFIYILILFNFISYSYASESNNEKTVIFTLGQAKTDFVFNFLLFNVSTKK